MSAHDDEFRYREEEAMERFLAEQLRQISENPVRYYLARYGDAIEERVQQCRSEAIRLQDAAFYGAALARYATAFEIAVRFFLVRPLLQGAFLTDEWAEILSKKIFKERTAEDRTLLPAILRKWNLDISKITLADGSQMWERFCSQVQPCRNDYVHAGGHAESSGASMAAECLDALLTGVVSPIAVRLGFTRAETNRWSVVLSPYDRTLNPPARYDTASPFEGEGVDGLPAP